MPDRAMTGSFVDLSLTFPEQEIGLLELRGRRAGGNPLSITGLRTLDEHLATISAAASAGSLKLLVIGTVSPHAPLTGYNLDELRGASADQVITWSREAQRILRRLETLSVPSVAAIQGEWLGGAAELALACTYRVASDDPAVKIGFPQIRFGLLPAWGGSVRLAREVGLSAAVDLVLTGRSLSATEAQRVGVVHRVVPESDFLLRVVRYAAQRLERGRSRSPLRIPLVRRLNETEPARRLIAARATRRFVKGGPGGSPARVRGLELLIEASSLPLEDGLTRETAVAGALIASSEAQGRLHAHHFHERALRRLPPGEARPEEAAVLGAGQTGSDIAHLLASGGVAVRIKDARHDLVREGVARARGRIDWEVAQGRISQEQGISRSSLLEGVTGFGGFGILEFVVATPGEVGEAPATLLGQVERHVQESCVLAFHDWTASPTVVQRELSHPERVLAIAPALPLDRFDLVEIVPGAQTSPEAVFAAHRLLRGLGRMSVVVSDQTPTPATRLQAVLFAEAGRLLDEGATIAQVDAAAVRLGIEVAPFHRIDAIGTPRVLRMLDALAGSLGERMLAATLFRRIAGEGSTFYRYRSGKPGDPNPALPEGLSPGGEAVTRMIEERLLLAMINEAALLLEEGAVPDAGDVDLISVLALGLGRNRGGLLFLADRLGIPAIVSSLEARSAKHGNRFAPAALLQEMAVAGEAFFPSVTPRFLSRPVPGSSP
jgi:3-hydroxyacyl-CoA dehydrogenase / enoyl-CoA hydratase / 3-hydroxybutyryl-CoA epimerase